MNFESAGRCCAVAALLVGAACASGPRADAANAPVEPDPPDAASAAPAPETPVSSPAADEPDAGDVDETPKDCNFRVKGFCFKTDEDACAAAGCDVARCMILESHPAKVKCRD
ncbi:MAG TPA: hypothetical protein VI072_21870 [Polyangiaceae bacterium]